MHHNPTQKKQRYLYEIDFMRILFISGVLLNHTVNVFTDAMNSDSSAYYGLISVRMMVHFSRMGFMFMSGLVLTMHYYDNHNWLGFLKKRFNGSIWTYFIWTFIIFTLPMIVGMSSVSNNLLAKYVEHLLQGDLYYMYYLLVTLQLYLVFPIIVWLFHCWPNAHNRILVISFVFQLALTTLIKYKLWYVDTSSWPYWFHAYSINVIAYQFFFIFGAYTSQHYEAINTFIHEHIRTITIIFIILSLGTIAYYRILNQNILGLSSDHAHSANQPYMMVFDTVAIPLVFWIGKQYAAWRKRGMPQILERLISTGAKISFGIYLDQIVGLLLLEWLLKLANLSDWMLLILLPVGWLFVIMVSFIIAWFFYKVPPLGFMIGRPQVHFKDIKKWFTNFHHTTVTDSDIEH